jgi:hypothetical protein
MDLIEGIRGKIEIKIEPKLTQFDEIIGDAVPISRVSLPSALAEYLADKQCFW